ncbi:MAG: L,D-transpeptidase family protein [Bacteroidales bacterium]|nr:L,D-transpeptidase family protein [Bacteroidales bacterium]
MISRLVLIIFIIILSSFQSDSFKDSQLKYSRVRQAYADKEGSMLTLLQSKQIDKKKLNLYLRAFKSEKQVELWGKNDTDAKYSLVKTYEICSSSGVLGPKRKQGDLQVPEGYYHINRFNPYSNFYLSLGINYPNKSDRILGVKGKLGGDIFIHGACVTIGCLPITDNHIKELYILCIEAKNNGQSKIPVTIFPSKLEDDEYKRLTDKYSTDTDKIGLWADLKKGYDIFNDSKQLPTIGFLNSGRHNVNI